MTKKVIIIGAGPGGLASAILLAGAGLKVRVLERLPVVGGRTSTLTNNGFTFDLGPTFFLYPRILDEILQAGGTSLQAEVEMTRLDPQYRVQFAAGGQIDATPDIAEMERQIAAICPADAGGFRRFLTDNRKKLGKFSTALEMPFLSWTSLLNRQLLEALPSLNPFQSVDNYLRRFFSDPRVRLTFSFQSKYLGMSPFRCPSLFSILSFIEYEHGVWHPHGGCGAVSNAMARVAERMGVEILTDTPVERILFDGRRAAGVVTAAGEHRADAVVMNADFANGISKLVPDHLRRRWTDKKLAKKKYSCSTFMMYLGAEGSWPDAAHHTIQISKDYERNLDQIELDRVVPDDPSFYVQNASVTDPSLAPKGHSALYLLAPVPHRSEKVDWQREAPAFRKKLLQRAEAAGFKGLAERIRSEHVITPDQWEHGYQIARGATFNLSHSLDQMLHLRPRNRFEDVDGLYLVGGGTHPGSGLPVIYEGARITSRLICEELGADTSRMVPRSHEFQSAGRRPEPTNMAASESPTLAGS